MLFPIQDLRLLAGIWSKWQGKDNSCRFDEARGELEPFIMRTMRMVVMMFDVMMAMFDDEAQSEQNTIT